MKKFIKVTQEHINKGRDSMEDLRGCPVALALHDNGFQDMTVGIYSCRDPLHHYLLPPHVSEFIRSLCRGKEVSPIEFELELGEVE